MSDTFFLIVGIIFAFIGLLLITAKVMSFIKCTVPINAAVVKPEKEHTYFRSVEYTHYRPVVKYVVDGKSYTQKAYFCSLRETKYPINSEMKIYYDPRDPEKIRFVGHMFPLPMGIVFLLIGAVLIYCYFL